MRKRRTDGQAGPDRRGFLRLAGAATAGVIAGAGPAVARAAPARASTVGASTVDASAASAAGAGTDPQLAGAYDQVTVDGRYVGLGLEGAEHALAAYAAIYEVTADDGHRRTAEAVLDFVLRQRPDYMGSYFGLQVLRSPFLAEHAGLQANLDSYVAAVLDRLAADPGAVLRTGQIRPLARDAELLVAYADELQRRLAAGSPDPDGTARRIAAIDAAAPTMLDRLVDLQLTYADAVGRFGNDRFTGAFPHLVEGDRGSMGSWDIEHWAPPMLSVDSYDTIRALARGYGRFRASRYNEAAAAGARQLLSTRVIDPGLIYAGAPAGFPLDGAEFLLPEEGGEQHYLVTYGWSPNAIAQLGTALRAVRDNQVHVPRSATWLRARWRGTPPPAVLDRAAFWNGLDAKRRVTHDFIEATELPVPATFPWIDLDRTTFPGTGDDPVRRDGWYDGSGRGTMSAVYSRLAVVGYVASGGRDTATLRRAAQWWDRMLGWEP